jgi:NF-kappa-B-activating protein C-terminal domain
MSDSVSRRDREDGSRHRHRSRSRDRRKRTEDNSEGSSPPARQGNGSPRLEQSERRRHHRRSHSHKRPRRSLSPGEIAPEKPHHSRHHSHKRKEKHHHDNETREKSKSPVKHEEHVGTPKSLESESSDSDEVFGPMPAPESEYTHHAKILVDISQQARSTRPRGRAEFGHDPKDIERYEQMGFVMSGNRKRRKVPQVTDDELRKAGFAVQKEVRDLKEKELVARFRELIETRKQDSAARR